MKEKVVVWKSQWIAHRGHEVRLEKIDKTMLYGLCKHCKLALVAERPPVRLDGPASRGDCEVNRGENLCVDGGVG